MRVPRYLSLIIFGVLFSLFSQSYAKNDLLVPEKADPEVQSFVRFVNEKRKSLGCPALRWDDRLAAVAQDHSRDMAARNFFSHTNPEGKGPFDRLKESKLGYSMAAENIAMGVHTGREAYQLWLHSPAHRKNMLDCRFTRQGIGRAGDRWTQVLIKP